MGDKCPKCGAALVPGTVTPTWACESVASVLDGQFAQSWACERLAARAAEIAALTARLEAVLARTNSALLIVEQAVRCGGNVAERRQLAVIFAKLLEHLEAAKAALEGKP